MPAAASTDITKSEELVIKAKTGEKLTTDERRTCIAYLMATQPELSNMDMAKMFGVTEGAIRKDKDIVRKEVADDISKDDVGLVIGDIIRTFDRLIVEIEKSCQKATLGTSTFIQHKKLVADLTRQKIEALQSLGYYPKNLGNLTQTKFVFKSHVNPKDGSVSTVALTPEEQKQHALSAPSDIKDAEFEEVKEHNLDTVAMLQKQAKFLPLYDKDTDEERELRIALAQEFSETGTERQDGGKATA